MHALEGIQDNNCIVEAVKIVCSLSEYAWGEAWLVMYDCLKRFDPERGKLEHLFRRAWKCRRKMLFKRKICSPLRYQMKDVFVAPSLPEPLLTDLPEIPNGEIGKILQLHLRGLTNSQVAYSLDKAHGTICSHLGYWRKNTRKAMLRNYDKREYLGGLVSRNIRPPGSMKIKRVQKRRKASIGMSMDMALRTRQRAGTPVF